MTRTMKRMLSLVLAVILGIVMLAPMQAEPSYAATPYLSARVLHMQPGQSAKLRLVHGKKVTWKTSNKKVATVKKGADLTDASAKEIKEWISENSK